jgi:hypothetical protein
MMYHTMGKIMSQVNYRRRRFLTSLMLVVAIIIFGFWQDRVNQQATPQSNKDPTPVSHTNSGLAMTALDSLVVKGRAPKTGYARTQFGDGWRTSGDCDTRDDILARDLQHTVIKDCKVTIGTLNDPYTGKTIQFTRGPQTSSAIQIDHVVAISDAWQKGAQQLSAATRADLANDPLELLAVDGPTNQAKSDGDAATWLPPNKAYRCRYVARQVAVKQKYSLWVTAAEKTAIENVLSTCPTQELPATP